MSKENVYAQLDILRDVPPSQIPESSTDYIYHDGERMTVKRTGTNIILYPPAKLSRGDKPTKYLTFGIIPMDLSNQWIKPAYFDEQNYKGRADNFDSWWSYYFGKDE